VAAERFLLDTSALYPLLLRLREGIVDYAERLLVLDLTWYELGNVLWKETRMGRLADPMAAAEMFAELLSTLETVSVHDDFREVLELALREGLTFYDAAYLHAARRLGVALATEDGRLLRYPEAIRVEELVRRLEGGGDE